MPRVCVAHRLFHFVFVSFSFLFFVDLSVANEFRWNVVRAPLPLSLSVVYLVPLPILLRQFAVPVPYNDATSNAQTTKTTNTTKFELNNNRLEIILIIIMVARRCCWSENELIKLHMNFKRFSLMRCIFVLRFYFFSPSLSSGQQR